MYETELFKFVDCLLDGMKELITPCTLKLESKKVFVLNQSSKKISNFYWLMRLTYCFLNPIFKVRLLSSFF